MWSSCVSVASRRTLKLTTPTPGGLVAVDADDQRLGPGQDADGGAGRRRLAFAGVGLQ